MVQIFPSDCPDQPFDEWMRARDLGQGLDFIDFERAKSDTPAVKGEQRIMVRGPMLRRSMTGDGSREHPVNRDPINVSGRGAEFDETARTHVHHHHHPVAREEERFASEEIDAPEAVLDVANEGQP
ncbi:MAG: hypothetical protein U0223_02660 [Nitrospira sp.]